MAEGDFFEHPGGFIELFPISTRAIAFERRLGDASQPYPPGPPAVAGDMNALGLYVDAHDGGGYFADYEGTAVTYLDEVGAIIPERSVLPSGAYETHMGVIWFDLGGLPTRIFERVELVLIPDADADEDADNRDLAADWTTTITPYEVEDFSVNDDFVAEFTGDSIFGVIAIADIVDYAASGVPLGGYEDLFPAVIGEDARWVIPINDFAILVDANRVGVRFHISGGLPTAGENIAVIECFFDDYDSEEYGTLLTQRAQALPHLRLWLGGGMTLPPAHGLIALGGSGQVEPLVDRDVVTHPARRERNRIQQPARVTRPR